MLENRIAPDLTAVLRLDPYAPRAARHRIALVDSPSPDLRDAVMLLSSELVTRAVERGLDSTIELRVWMPEDVVRVELHGSADTIEFAASPEHPYATVMLDQLSDRWEVHEDETSACLWFEIDRLARPVALAG
jgi:hypothetical protein